MYAVPATAARRAAKRTRNRRRSCCWRQTRRIPQELRLDKPIVAAAVGEGGHRRLGLDKVQADRLQLGLTGVRVGFAVRVTGARVWVRLLCLGAHTAAPVRNKTSVISCLSVRIIGRKLNSTHF